MRAETDGLERGRRSAEAARDRYGLVLILVLLTYLLASTLPSSRAATAVIVTVQGVTIVVTLAASQSPMRLRRIAAGLAALLVLAGVTATAAGAGYGAADLISALLLTASLLAILRRIARHERVGVQTILGAVSSYMLLGLIFAFFFAGIAHIESGAFFQSGADETLSNFLFFS